MLLPCITNAQVFSDAMDSEFILGLADTLGGTPFTWQGVSEKLAAAYRDTPLYTGYIADIAKLIFEETPR